jgi:hypothetical protein
MPLRWADQQAAVGDQRCTSNDRRFVAGKEQAARCDFLGCRGPLKRRVLGDVTVGIFGRDAPLLDQ